MLKQRGCITSHRKIEDICELWLKAPDIARRALPGQFVSVFLKDKSRLLPRPISICGLSEDKNSLRLVYRITRKGSGTEALSNMKPGEEIDMLGPAGNGFPLESRDTMLIGGGIGIPPMLELAKSLRGKRTIVLGYKNSNTFLKAEFERYGEVYTASDDGSVGIKGTVIEVLNENKLAASTVMACGPLPMLRAVKAYCALNNLECYVSLEERMACSIGACLACVCETVKKDGHSNVNNARICKDGPVFRADEVIL